MLFAPISEIFVPDHMLNLGKMFSSCKSGCGSMGQIFSQATVIPIIPISHLAFLNLLFLMSSLLKYIWLRMWIRRSASARCSPPTFYYMQVWQLSLLLWLPDVSQDIILWVTFSFAKRHRKFLCWVYSPWWTYTHTCTHIFKQKINYHF